jgi:4-hydroxy-4-methyl-2-oxoglutarate aldolase
MVRIVRALHGSGVTPGDIARWREVPVAIAVDLDLDPGQIDPAIRPLLPPGQQPRLFGHAVTVQCQPPDFGAVLHALEVIHPGDVLVIAASGDAHTAMIGEILSGHLRSRGAVGLVVDGAVRDVATLAGWPDFAVFARHITPRGPVGLTKGEVNVPVAVGGVTVSPGDLIIGDDDGLVALSPTSVRDGIERAEAKIAVEVEWVASLARGISVRETFGLADPEER